MINKEKLYQTLAVNGITVKTLSEILDMNYQTLLRKIKNSDLSSKHIEFIIKNYKFSLYTPTEVFFSGLDNESL